MARESDLGEAVEALKNGKSIVYPTETCYGLGCDALNENAVEEIYDIKKRPRKKKLTAIVSDLEMAENYCNLSKVERRVCREFMPGPLTLIADKKEKVPNILNDKFAFRIPGHKLCRELCESFGGPVVATSANISGNPSSYSIEDIHPEIRKKVEVVLNHGELERNRPSTIIDIQESELKVHRQGPVKTEDVRGVIDGG